MARFYIFLTALFFVQGVWASELSATYDIDIDFSDFKSRSYPLDVEATIKNNSKDSLDHLVWIFYSNRFVEKLPNVNEVNHHRIYPHGVSKGGFDFNQIWINGAVTPSNGFEPLNQKKYGTVFLKQKLTEPLLPGAQIVIKMKGVLDVPHKYGSFGWYRDQLTLSGGWSPTLVSFKEGAFDHLQTMPMANWRVRATKPDSIDMVTDGLKQLDDKAFESQSRQLSLRLGKLDDFTLKKNQMSVHVLHTQTKDKNLKKGFSQILTNFESFVTKHELGSGEQMFTMAQAPLREVLTTDGVPISFFSDRAFKVINMLKHFHQIPIYKSLFMQLLQTHVSVNETDEDVNWVLEVLCWHLADTLVQSLNVKHRDARDIGALRLLRWLPLIDRVLYTPQFAFYDVFYNLVYPKDFVLDDIRRYPYYQPFGQTILAHMQDEFGASQTKDLINAYIKRLPQEGFRSFSATYFNKDIGQAFTQWTSPRPRVNYALVSDKENKHLVTVKKKTKKEIIEPVTVQVTYKDQTAQRQTWKGAEDEHTFTFDDSKDIKSIEIDPNNRLLETARGDNRKPNLWKFVVNSMFAEYDVAAKQPLFLVQGQFRKTYGGLDRFDLGGYSYVNTYGANVGYTRLFGKSIDALRLNHGFRVSLNFNRLADARSFVPQGQGFQPVVVTPSGFVSDVSLAYIFGNQISYINPMAGAYGGLTLRVSNPLFGSQYKYYMLRLNIAGIKQMHPNHLWGIRFQAGTSGNSEMPAQLQYRLGGISSIKGLGLSADDYTAKHMVMLTNEYRHFLVQDMDLDLWLFRVRKIQGALYSSVGHATHTVSEQAGRLVGQTSKSTDFWDLANLSNWQADVGYGLRFHVDYFGVSPSLVSFDVARSVTDNRFGWLFYFGVNQSF